MIGEAAGSETLAQSLSSTLVFKDIWREAMHLPTVSVPGNTTRPNHQPTYAAASTSGGLLRRQYKTTKNQESMTCKMFVFFMVGV